MSVTNQPPAPGAPGAASSAKQGKVDDYQIMQHVGEFTRSAATRAASALNVVLIIFIGLMSLALFWVVATMIGLI
jgi:hypothetical protein